MKNKITLRLFLVLVLTCYSFFVHAQTSDVWIQQASFGGSGRCNAASFSIGTKGYIGTGTDGSNCQSDFWVYDQASNAWTQIANFAGGARQGAVGMSIGNQGYVGTGISNGATTWYADWWEYDPTGNTWVQKANFPGAGRSSAAGFSIGSKGYLGTGTVNNFVNPQNDFWEYDPSTNVWTQQANAGTQARMGATGLTIGNKGYFAYGQISSTAYSNDFLEYDPTTNTWTQKATTGGAARGIAAGFSLGTKGYVGGGVYSSGYISTYLQDFWEYDQPSDTWTQRANYAGSGRTGMAGFSIGTKGYMGIGLTYPNTGHIDFWEYIPTCNITATVTAEGYISCHGGNAAYATFTASGGLGTLTYSWAPYGGTSNTASSLVANTYTCTITDANGCTYAPTVTVTQPTAVTNSVSAQTNVLCNGGNNGAATVNVSGGTPPGYTYSWTPSGGTAATASNLTAGTYTCNIKDGNLCPSTQTVTITQPTVLTTSVSSQTNVLCNGFNTGAATIAANGGTTAYSYSWTPSGGTASTATNLMSGTYTCIIADANGCTKTQSVNITQPNALTSSLLSQTNVSGCFGQNNGSVSVLAGGGTGTLTYSWFPSGGTSNSASNLTGGTYTCIITDANNCIKNQTVTITQPAAITTIVLAQTNLSCYGTNNGAATVSASGGTGTLNYNWSPSGGATNSASNLASGSYVCTVTDANSCTKTQTVSITQPSAITSSIVSQNNVSCTGGSDGLATISAGGGTGTLNYNWVPSGGTSVTATNLVVGSYSCVITDSNNCTHLQPVVISQNVLSAPDICLVTTDSASGYNYNIIYWDKTGYMHVDSFIVYRYDVSSVSYLRIGAVSNDSLSAFMDTARTVGGGSHGGDPNYTSWKYKLAILDTCGNISPQSPYHQTVFLQNLGSGNFGISQYVIETGQTNPVSGYDLFRDNFGANNYQLLIPISGSSATDPSYSSYPNANYRVDILGFSCNPTYRLSGNNNTYVAKVKSHSNTNNNRGMTTGLKQLMENNNLVSVYPNPNNGNFTIEAKGYVRCIMYDVNGKEVLTQTINGKTTIDASSLTEGVYNLSVISKEGIVNKRLVIVK